MFGEYLLRSFGIDPVEHYMVARGLVGGRHRVRRGRQHPSAPTSAPSIVGVVDVRRNSPRWWCWWARRSCFGGAHGASVSHLTAPAAGPIAVGSMGLALVSVLWAYDGWADLSFAAGEVKDPQRNLPRAIILGTLALIGIYVLTNVAYLYVHSDREPIRRSPLVAADTMMALFGRAGVVLVSVFVMISSFSSLNGSMLASPRVFFAMADDGLFFEPIAKRAPALSRRRTWPSSWRRCSASRW